MTTLLEDIARIVRQERAARGISLAQLASAVNVRAERLEALEQGRPSVEISELDRLAGELGLDPVALADGQRVEGASAAVFLRHRSSFQDFNPADADVFAWALSQGKALFSLSSEDVKARVARLAPEEVRKGPDHAPAKHGHELARRVRDLLGSPMDPLGDMRAFLEEQFGIAVLQASLATTTLPAAATRAMGQQGAAVVLNASDEDRRKNPLLDRVHLAHELCHILFDPKENGVQLVLEVEGLEDLHEQRARAFAAELLVPSAALPEALQGRRLVTNASARQAAIRIRELFQVPWELTIQQLRNHDWLAEGLADELLEGGPGAYQKRSTSLPAPRKPSLGLCAALERALDEAIVTEGEVRVLLGCALGEPLPWEARGSAT
jgi:Zn-dependent peptidase ImmA (M78 family)/transcriptional regulator with XRE-family HTH domain